MKKVKIPALIQKILIKSAEDKISAAQSGFQTAREVTKQPNLPIIEKRIEAASYEITATERMKEAEQIIAFLEGK